MTRVNTGNILLVQDVGPPAAATAAAMAAGTCSYGNRIMVKG